MRRQVFPLLLLSSQACSLQVPEPAACATNLECRDAFGQGSVCGEAGLCETAAVPERCVGLRWFAWQTWSLSMRIKECGK